MENHNNSLNYLIITSSPAYETAPEDPIAHILYRIFCGIEIIVHIMSVLVAMFFIIQSAKPHLIHVNLHIILYSFIMTLSATSIIRFPYCFVIMIGLPENVIDADLFFKLRDICMCIGGLHLFLIAIERLVATIRADRYEAENHAIVVLVSIFILWVTVCYVIFKYKDGPASRFLIVGALTFPIISAIVVMFFVRTLNYRNWQNNRGELSVGHVYQLRENVITSLALSKCFFFMTVQTTICLISYFGYALARFIYLNIWLEKFTGFIFDVGVATSPFTVCITLSIYHPKVKLRIIRYYREAWNALYGSEKNMEEPVEIIDLDGRVVTVKTSDETAVYFDQLKAAWA